MTMQAQAPTQRVQSPPAFLNAPGEMAELIRTVDWSQTPLGPAESWPQSLRTSLSICLHSHFPILLWWGPELVMLYNDAYRPMLGASKHPAAMGQPGQQCWAEIWHIIGPMLAGVLQEGKATWSENQMLPLDRNGYVEECYFTFSYSPISDESGGIGGVFCAVTETTQQVISARRLRILNELAAHANAASTQTQALALAADTLLKHSADLPFTLVYRLDPAAQIALLETSTTINAGHALSPERIDLASHDQVWPLAALLTGEGPPYLLLENVRDRIGPFPGGAWPEHPDQVLILPIQQEQHKEPYGFFIAGISPRRAFDEQYHSFLSLVADQLSSALSRSAAYEHERKRAEALAAIDRAKTVFFSNVSHEFRTPLTLMLAPLEDAFSSAQPCLHGEDLDILHRNALRLLKLVNTLLDFSRIEAGRAQARFRPTDLATLTADLASMFCSAIEKAGLSLTVECPSLPTPIYVDTDMWEKIVLNLLSNAFKFTFAGEIAVSLQALGSEVELSVRDTGTGIASHELPNLFKRFHRIKGAQSRSHEGTGIGNALVKELVELHGGSIEVASQWGEGTTFRVCIPMGKKHLPAEQVEADASPPSPGIGADAFIQEALHWLPGEPDGLNAGKGEVLAATCTPSRCPPGKGADASKKILVVEDNADMRQYLLKLLRPCWQVETVANGASALQAAQENPADLILTDVMMPEMDGLELVKRLRNSEKTRNIPIIIISARAGEEAHVEGVETGADDYIIKPFSSRELLARIGTNLQLAQIRQHADREIIENERRLRAYIQTSSDLIYRMSPDWGEMTMLTGNGFLVDTEAPGSNWIETYIHSDDRAQVLAAIEEALHSTGLYELEHRIIRADGSPGWVHARAVPVRADNGGILEWIGTARDITERKKTEQRLQEESAGFLAILEQLPVGFAVLDSKGRVTMRNAIMLPYAGGTIPALDPQQSRKIEAFDPQGNVLPPDLWPSSQALRGVSTYAMESTYTHDDGRVDWHLISAVPVLSEDGGIAGAIAVLQNISRQKEVEQELREINEHLDSLVQTRTAAAEGKTEQLRSLTAQLIEVEENERRKFAALLHDDVQQIIGAAHVQMQSLGESLPDTALLTDIAGLLQNAIARTRYLSNEISPPVLYHTDLASGLRWLATRMRDQFQLDVRVEVDPAPRIDDLSMKRFVFRAAQELLYNVVKHARSKQAQVKLTESPDGVLLEVSDQGAGFDPANLDGSQAGFGLMTIQERARYVGGSLTIESAAGQGSRFTLRLPNPDKKGRVVHRRRASDRIDAPAATSWKPSPTAYRVLVVDDHHLMRQGLVNLLQTQPAIQVIGEAGNGQEALDQTRRLHPDVVLMDISMPVMGGVEATRRLKKEFPAVRVIGLSMHQDLYISEHMHNAGAETTLTKTAGATELIKAIEGRLEGSKE